MKYTLDLLDKAIDRYLKDKTSTDPDFFKEHFIKQREKSVSLAYEPYDDLFAGVRRFHSQLESDIFKSIYTAYRIRNFRSINELFRDCEHELIITRYTEQEIEDLLKKKEIELIPGLNPITSGFDADEYPCLDHYKIVNIEIKDDLFRVIKWCIRWKEFERKLRPKVKPLLNNGQPLIKHGLEKVIYKDYVELFYKIESKLMEQGFLSDNYFWQKNKTELSNFLVTIIGFKYTNNSVKEIEVRKFF